MADPSKVRGILGLFSKAAPAEEGVNLSRRGVLGLPRKSEVLLPSQVETHLPAVVAPAESSPVVGAIEQVIAEKMAKPTTRREFMGEGVKAAASAALRRAAPGALKQATKRLLKPQIDETAAAGKIADYVSSVYSDDKAAATAYKILSDLEGRIAKGKRLNWIDRSVDSMDSGQSTAVWAELINLDAKRGPEAAKAIGLDTQTIAKQTGLPADLVKKLVGSEENLINELSDAAGTDLKIQQIIEDGRGREAARSSSYVDLFEDVDFVNESLQKAMKELGPDANPDDIISKSHDILLDRFKEMERGPSDNLFLGEMRKRIVPDEVLDDVWRQAGEEYNTPDLINDALKEIRNQKPVAEVIEVAPPAAAAGQFPWRNDVLRWFESHEGTPHGSDRSYVANRALNYGDDASSWVKDFKKYHDELSASNPNASVAEKISTMQSQTGLPAEFVEAIFNRIP
jgi:hypothetical protein